MADPRLVSFRASDGYAFYARVYAPAGVPKGRILYLHGIRSHGGWYERSCRVLAAAGYEVHFPDRRGSGMNTARRGDTPSFRRLLDDLGEYVLHLRADRPWLPTFVAGVSWGGKLAVGLQYRHPGLTDGLLLLCPGLAPRVAPPLLTRAGIVRSRVRNPERFFPIPLNDPDLFTASPACQKYVAEEPHGLRQATARFLFASAMLDYYLRRAAKRVTAPTLLMLAEQDRVIDNDRTRAMMERFPAGDKTVIHYSGAHHTLEFETDGHPWAADVVGWIEERL